MKFWKKLIGFILLIIFCCCNGIKNPYRILGVNRTDSKEKIKKAYKELALKWHPDKTDDPEASDKMIEINEAYQILSDPKKKAEYDNFGTVSDDGGGSHDKRRYAHHHFYNEFRGPNRKGSFRFEDFPFGSSFYHSHDYQKKNILNDYNYKNIVLPDSHHKLFLILVTHDRCFDCLKIQDMWDQLAENFNDIGIGVYELFYNENPLLANEIGANTYPQFIAVVAKRPIKYKGEMSERSIRDFMATILPHHLITPIVENDKEFFEQSLQDNKPQVLLFSKHMYTPLLFQVVAYEYYTKVNFAYVNIKDLRTKRLTKKYNINPSEPTLLVLKEDQDNPVKLIQGSALKRGTLRDVVTSNLHLFVPRLSSQQIFDDLCTKNYLTQRELCVILFTTKGSNYSMQIQKFRKIVRDGHLNEKKVKLFYLFSDIQEEFVKKFSESTDQQIPCSDGNLRLKMLILWRHPKDKIYYDWYSNGWCEDRRPKELINFIESHIDNELEMNYETTEPQLEDEHWPGYIWDFIKKSYSLIHNTVDALEHPSWSNTPTIGFFSFVLVMMFIGLVMPSVSELNFYNNDNRRETLPRHSPPEVNTTVLGLLKFDYNSQDRLLHNAQRGLFTVVVLVDSSNLDDVASSPIIRAFADSIYGYSGNSPHTFTWLSLSENLSWCQEVMDIRTFGEFLPGCVMALNGYRKYAYIFKPDFGNTTRQYQQSQISADFIGFESSEDESVDSYQLLERCKERKAALKVRTELPRWLERLFDGLLRDKKRLEKWPKMEMP